MRYISDDGRMRVMCLGNATLRTECPICYGTNISYCASNTDRRKGLRGEWDVWTCTECGVLFINPMPSEKDLYCYYSVYSPSERFDFTLGKGSRHPSVRRLYHVLSGDVDPRDFILLTKGSRVLDYGSGNSAYLRDWHSRGMRIAGAEIIKYIVEASQVYGYEMVHVEVTDRIPYPDNEFDCVYLMQVLEHILQPHALFRELWRILKPSGEVYLAVPNSRSIWRRVFGKYWVSGWFAPFHLFHYNFQSIGELASTHGFEIIDFWTSTPESWFRLNLKALIYKGENQLDATEKWADRLPCRLILMILLRAVDLLVREKDCLVVKLRKTWI